MCVVVAEMGSKQPTETFRESEPVLVTVWISNTESHFSSELSKMSSSPS